MVINKGFNLFDILAEIVVLTSLIITNLSAPVEKEYDERVIVNINQHYNKAFKIILPLALVSYLISVILIIKTNSKTVIPPNLFINTFLFIVFIGLIFLVRKHRIYLNNNFLESDDYYLKVLSVIGIGIIVTIGLIIFSFLFDIVIKGASSLNTMFNVLVVSYITISIQYLLYSVYEYNHYNESIEIDNGKLPIVTRNMVLFLSLYVVFSIITMFRIISINLYTINQNLSTSLAVTLSTTLYYPALINKLLIMIVIVYSLKASLTRLTNYSYPIIRSIIILTIALVISIFSYEVFNLFTNINIYKEVDPSRWIRFAQSVGVVFGIIKNLLNLSILILLFIYANKYNYKKNKLLLIPILFLVLANIATPYIIFPITSYNYLDVSLISLKRNLLNIFFCLSSFAIYYILVFKYKKTYEIIEQKEV